MFLQTWREPSRGYRKRQAIWSELPCAVISWPAIACGLSVLGALLGEEGLQQRPTFLLAHAARDFTPMIQRGKLQQVHAPPVAPPPLGSLTPKTTR